MVGVGGADRVRNPGVSGPGRALQVRDGARRDPCLSGVAACLVQASKGEASLSLRAFSASCISRATMSRITWKPSFGFS